MNAFQALRRCDDRWRFRSASGSPNGQVSETRHPRQRRGHRSGVASMTSRSATFSRGLPAVNRLGTIAGQALAEVPIRTASEGIDLVGLFGVGDRSTGEGIGPDPIRRGVVGQPAASMTRTTKQVNQRLSNHSMNPTAGAPPSQPRWGGQHYAPAAGYAGR